jgi:hypothetical protein
MEEQLKQETERVARDVAKVERLAKQVEEDQARRKELTARPRGPLHGHPHHSEAPFLFMYFRDPRPNAMGLGLLLHCILSTKPR